MSERRPWFKFWTRDFFDSERVRVMSAEGVALYLMLLAEQWHAGRISSACDYWKRVHGWRFQDFDSAWSEVAPCFDSDGDRMLNARLEIERDDASSRQKRRSESAAHAARMRWACGSDAKKEKEIKKETKKEKEKREDARARKAFYERPPWEEFPVLDNDQTREAWAEFIGTKKRRAAGPLTEAAVRRHMKTLASLGPTQAVECLRYSAEGNYPTIYPDRFQAAATTNGRPKLTPTQQGMEDLMETYRQQAAERDAQKDQHDFPRISGFDA